MSQVASSPSLATNELDPLRNEMDRRATPISSRGYGMRALLPKVAPPHSSSQSLPDDGTLAPQVSAKSKSKRSIYKTVHTSKSAPHTLKQVVGVQEYVSGGHKSAAGAVWSLEFSSDGIYMAAAGKDGLIRIWKALDPSERGAGDPREQPLFTADPIRTLAGHSDEITDLKWSKNNFIVTASLDKTVRLWHVARSKCLAIFNPEDIVTSVAFHPTDDRFFLTGSLSHEIALWSIPDREIVYSRMLSDMVTAVSFTPDGRHCLAGCYNGRLVYLLTQNLKVRRTAQVGNSLKPKGTLKITGMKVLTRQNAEPLVLVSSNSNRVRFYNLRDLSLERRFRGPRNEYSHTAANISDDGTMIICGSEDHRTYVWSIDAPIEGLYRQVLQNEWIHSNHAAVSAAHFVPNALMARVGLDGVRAFVSADTSGVIRVYVQSFDRQVVRQVKGTLKAAPLLFLTYGKVMGRAASHALVVGGLR